MKRNKVIALTIILAGITMFGIVADLALTGVTEKQEMKFIEYQNFSVLGYDYWLGLEDSQGMISMYQNINNNYTYTKGDILIVETKQNVAFPCGVLVSIST